MTRILAFDLSLNHAGVVELTNGHMSHFAYYTDHAKTAERHEHGHRIMLLKSADKQYAQMHRLAQIESWVVSLLKERRPEYAGIEGYSYNSKQGAHQLGEAGGVARIWLWKFGVRFRIHDPLSVKMFVAHDGTAQKDLIESSVADRWDIDFGWLNPPPTKSGKENRRTSEDLADAYGIARLIDLEIRLRAGTIRLDELGHDKERQVFNRTTKTFPVSLLGREWIHNEKGSFPPAPDERRDLLRRSILRHKGLIVELLRA